MFACLNDLLFLCTVGLFYNFQAVDPTPADPFCQRVHPGLSNSISNIFFFHQKGVSFICLRPSKPRLDLDYYFLTSSSIF